MQVTDLNVRLKGTVVSPNGFALAMIEDRSQRDESLYMEGDRIQDAEILEIREDKVILRRAGRDETLKLFAEKPRKQGRWKPPARTTARRRYAQQRSARSTAVSGSGRRAQQRVRSLMAQLRLRPHYEKGKPAGFKVGQVRLGSVFQAEGLEKGDIVVAINDEDVRTPNQLLKAYREAAEDEEIWLDIIRDGEEDSVEVDLEEIIGSD
jgi:general secretion pathway protein C